MSREQLISRQAAYGLEQDFMSLKSYLQHKPPNKKCMVIRELITAVFHLLLLLLLLLLLPPCLGATSGSFYKSLVSMSCSQRGCFQRPNLIKMSYAVIHTSSHPLKKKKKNSNSPILKAVYLVEEKRILNFTELLWPLP